MLKLFDWGCRNCEHVLLDSLDPPEQKRKKCPECGKMLRKLVTCRGGLTDYRTWIKKTVEVIDKEDRSPEAMELRRSESFSSLDKYMKKEGVRFLQDGEKTITAKDREAATKERMDRHVHTMTKAHIRRQRIEVRG